MVRAADLMAAFPLASADLPFPLDLAGATSLSARCSSRSGASAAGRARPSAAAPSTRPASGPPVADPTRRRIGRAVVAAVCAVAVIGATTVALVTRPGGALLVSVLDVGQGDAILVEADDGTRVLVDGGGDPDVLVRRLDERVPIWDRRIDVVLLTHPHEDHVGGLAGLLPRYRVGVFAENGMRSDGSGYTAFREQADALRRRGSSGSRSGDAFSIGRARAEVVWPPSGSVPETAPDSGTRDQRHLPRPRHPGRPAATACSRATSRRTWISGSSEALDPVEGRLDLLKVAHHGSATAIERPAPPSPATAPRGRQRRGRQRLRAPGAEHARPARGGRSACPAHGPRRHDRPLVRWSSRAGRS